MGLFSDLPRNCYAQYSKPHWSFSKKFSEHIYQKTSIQRIKETWKNGQFPQVWALLILSSLIVLLAVQNGHVKHWENGQFFTAKCSLYKKRASKLSRRLCHRRVPYYFSFFQVPNYEWCSSHFWCGLISHWTLSTEAQIMHITLLVVTRFSGSHTYLGPGIRGTRHLTLV